MKIIFAGTPDIAAAVLTPLIDSSHEIILCLSQPDRPHGRGRKLKASPVKELAESNDIKVQTPTTVRDSDFIQSLAKLKPDLILVMAYGLLLPNEMLHIAKYGCINLHASILPRWRGAAPIQYAILHGDKQTGITMMQMDAGMDTGDILKVYPVAIDNTDTSDSLTSKLATVGQENILSFLDDLEQGKIQATPQDTYLASYAPKINKAEAAINWHQPAEQLARMIRAYNPWPVAFTTFQGQNLRIWQATALTADNAHHQAGEIAALSKDGFAVKTAKGLLEIESLQLPGKQRQSARDFINAHPKLSIGDSLCLQ